MIGCQAADVSAMQGPNIWPRVAVGEAEERVSLHLSPRSPNVFSRTPPGATILPTLYTHSAISSIILPRPAGLRGLGLYALSKFDRNLIHRPTDGNPRPPTRTGCEGILHLGTLRSTPFGSILPIIARSSIVAKGGKRGCRISTGRAPAKGSGH
jgi:hypothetical protein